MFFFFKIPKREMVWRWFGKITPVCFGGFYVRYVESHLFFGPSNCKLSSGPTWLQHRQGLSLGPDEARELRSGNSRTSIQHDLTATLGMNGMGFEGFAKKCKNLTTKKSNYSNIPVFWV